MRKQIWLGVTAAALVLGACGTEEDSASSASASRSERVEAIFEAEQFIGVPRPYTGTTNPIRGVNGGGLPWVVTKVEAKLFENSVLDVEVKGLVFDPNDPDVIAAGRANRNTVAAFRAILSCRSVNQDRQAVVVNVPTEPFPATLGLASEGGGNAHIVQRIDVPKPCIAPIVFVTSPTSAWFAASGF